MPSLCLTVIVLLMFASVCVAADDRANLVLDFLVVGDINGWPNHLGDDEPAIEVTLVPCRAYGTDMPDEYLYRWSRVYFPRGMEMLMDYETLLFNHPRLAFFTLPQQFMMVEYAGTPDKTSIAYPLSHYEDVQEPWLNSPIKEVFPIDAEKFYSASSQGLPDEFDGLVRLRLEAGMDPVFSAFEPSGIYGARVYESMRPAYAKSGAKIWVSMIDGPPSLPDAPAFLSWRYEKSETWGFGLHPGERAKHFAEGGGWWELIFLNICYYTGSREILQFDEALAKRLVKSQFSYYRESGSMFQSIVNFVSMVGANTARAEAIQREGDMTRDSAELHYLRGEYDLAKIEMEEAVGAANLAMSEATKAKDRALTWIYVSEWLSTLAVSVLAGYAVWALMIRRKLYREVSTTRQT